MPILKILASPIAFHRVLADITGSALDALFLSQCIYWTNTLNDDRDGWFFKTAEEWHKETGMSRSEIETARKSLKRAGVLEEKRAGVPCTLHFRVNVEKLQTSLRETCKLDCGKPADLFAQNVQTPIKTENTSKTTTERGRATEQELKDFCTELGLPTSDAEFLYHKWCGNGWKNGTAPIKDWKATVRSWKAAGYLPSQKLNGHAPLQMKGSYEDNGLAWKKAQAEQEAKLGRAAS